MRHTIKTATKAGLLTAALVTSATALPASAATTGRAVGAATGKTTAPGAAARSADAGDPAYFEMTDITGYRFVVKMTDQEDIDHARALLDGSTDQMPHILGRIIKRPAPYNPRWSFELEPRSIAFFDVSIEVCDATIPYVEDHLDEVGGAFLPGGFWCDWSSRLVRELPGG